MFWLVNFSLFRFVFWLLRKFAWLLLLILHCELLVLVFCVGLTVFTSVFHIDLVLFVCLRCLLFGICLGGT